MIQIISKVHCKCGARYHIEFVQTHIPKGDTSISCAKPCPICNSEYTVSYEFKATCKHCGGFFNFDHFSQNDGFTDPEYYPRQCQCGHETILEQRRMK